ncbi:response regulator [Marinospirillum alkaliphilum]|uniref:Response regulator receiver domain-containing protein n=1 Tax=Marinospirillum alkaliphilum DSM 21637 TaxID=1122209 RepID=A0A1K1WKS3_9GAMM|nr:response regulator [Marinospirillum alkaliphilum]SFX37855.1 Response regulator receiver domain-containing protein [Marinospirillum alkaliphilum DSM 21637]
MTTIRILSIDDDKFIRELIDKTLRSELKGFEIHQAENGKKAQQLLQNHSFDLVLCDWEMPEMTGIELLKWVRKQETLKAQPFVLITSLDQKEHVVEAGKAGVSDYLSKPFSPKQLIDKVMKQLIKSGRVSREEAMSLMRKDRIAAAGGAELLAGGGAPRAAAPARRSKGKGLLNWDQQRCPVAIREINREEALLTLKTPKGFPSLGGQVQLLLAAGTDEAPVRISVPALVYSLQLAEKTAECDTAHLRIQLQPESAEAAAQLAKVLLLVG